MMSSAMRGSGNVCVRLFFVRSGGKVHIPMSMSISLQRMPPTSERRCAGKQQQLDDAAETIITAGAPDRGKLGIGQHARAGLRVRGGDRADHGIDLAQPMAQGPGVHRTERGARPGGGGGAALGGDLGDASGDVAARDLIDRHAVQRLEVRPGQVTLKLAVGIRSHHLAPGGEIVGGHRPQCVFVSVATGDLVGLRVLAERDLGEDLLRRRTRAIGIQNLGRAKQQASRGTGAAILNDPRSADLTAARSDAETESGQRVIEMDHIGLALRQLGGRGGLGGELHFPRLVGKRWGSGEAASPCPIPAMIGKLKCHVNRQKTSSAPLPARLARK